MEKLSETWLQLWSQALKQFPFLAYWQYGLVLLVILIIFKKPIKRFVKRQVRKGIRLVVRLARLYFTGM